MLFFICPFQKNQNPFYHSRHISIIHAKLLNLRLTGCYIAFIGYFGGLRGRIAEKQIWKY